MLKKSLSTLLTFLFIVSPCTPLWAMNSDNNSNPTTPRNPYKLWEGAGEHENDEKNRADEGNANKDQEVIEIESDSDSGSEPEGLEEELGQLEDDIENYIRVLHGKDSYRFIKTKPFLDKRGLMIGLPFLIAAGFFEVGHRGAQVSAVVLKYMLKGLWIDLTPKQIYQIIKGCVIFSTLCATSLIALRQNISQLEFVFGLKNGTLWSMLELYQSSKISGNVSAGIGIHEEAPEIPDWQGIPNITLPVPNVSIPLPPTPDIAVPPVSAPPSLFPIPGLPVPVLNPSAIPLPGAPDIDALVQQKLEEVTKLAEKELNDAISAANSQGQNLVQSVRDSIPRIDLEKNLSMGLDVEKEFPVFNVGFGSKNQSSLLGNVDIGAMVRAILPASFEGGAIRYDATIGIAWMSEYLLLGLARWKERPRIFEEFFHRLLNKYFSENKENKKLPAWFEKMLEIAQNPWSSSASVGSLYVGMHLLVYALIAKLLNSYSIPKFEFAYNSPPANAYNASLVDTLVHEGQSFPGGFINFDFFSLANSSLAAASIFNFDFTAGAAGLQQIGNTDTLLILGLGLFAMGMIIDLLQKYAYHHEKTVVERWPAK